MPKRPVLAPATNRRKTMAIVVLLFWAAQYATITAQRMLFMPEDDTNKLLPRFLVTMVAIALSLAIGEVHGRLHRWTLDRRLVAVIGLAMAGSIIHASVNFLIFQLFMPKENWQQAELASYVMSLLHWFWSYAALSGHLLALSYSSELAERERRIADLQRVAHGAQLRALRYQLNPHFMFNTLNSVAALISRRKVDAAEQMVENLADFLRAGLTLDPQEDITLEREIALQSLYLAIEVVRFPDRLQVEIEVEKEAQAALVPSLVTQPLVENVIRHAVARSTGPVTLTIRAYRREDRLHVSVINSQPDGEPRVVPGTGVGLKNVVERLRVRFGHDCSFTAGPQPDGRFAVAFAIPFEAAP